MSRDPGVQDVVDTPVAVSPREIKAWSKWMRAAGKPSSTIDLRTYHVRRVMRAIDRSPWELTVDDLVEFLAAQGWAAETRRSYRASLRAFYAWGQATGRRRDSPAHLLPVVTVPRGVPRPVPEDAFQEALRMADHRELLMLMLAGHCGLRRGEISRVRREDLVEDLDGWSLRVRGKGGHERLVPLPDDLARRLRACDPGWIFPSVKRPGPLTPAHVGVLVSDLLPPGWTCHTLRHRCGTRAYAADRDLRAVQELLGHAKTDTTALYTRVPSGAVRNAMRAAAS